MFFNLPLELKISLIKYKEYDIPMISPSSTRVESEKWVKIRPGNESTTIKPILFLESLFSAISFSACQKEQMTWPAPGLSQSS